MKNTDLFQFIKPHEVEIAAKTLVDAFKEDPINNFLFPNEKYVFLFYITAINYCRRYGIAIKSAHFEAVGLYLKPKDQFNNYWRFLRSGMILFFLKLPFKYKLRFLSVNHLLNCERKKLMGDSLYWYGWIAGTQSEAQAHGYGRAIVNYLLDLSKKSNLPIYIQTATERAEIYHKRNHFVTKKVIDVNKHLKFFLMIRNPQ